MKTRNLNLSGLGHTWIFDLDGTIFEHNLYLKGQEKLLPEFKKFYRRIPKTDSIVLLTAREAKYRANTLRSLKRFGIRFEAIVFGLPKGERILFNDIKPSGLRTAMHFNVKRNSFPKLKLTYKK